MKRQFLLIFGCLLTGILSIYILYVYSNAVNHSKNGFIRLFPPHVLGMRQNLDIKFNSYYISGLTSQRIYLGNKTAPTHLLITDYNLSDTNHYRLPIPRDTKLVWGAVRVKIDSPYFYMTEYLSRYFTQSHIYDGNGVPSKLDSLNFTQAAPIGPSSLIVRTYNSNLRQNVLTKAVIQRSKKTGKTYILEKQIDGTFCTDGELHYNKDMARALYLYYYRNEFIVFDSSLNLLYKGNTIDTTSRVQIKVDDIISPTKVVTTLSAPPKFVNKKCYISGDRIYVNSALLADNEEREMFDQHAVIDVYRIKNGEYHFSFYLPKHLGNNLKDFAVYNKKIVALYDHHILTFTLKF